MCGICGFIGKGDLTDLKRMTDAMIHRGPDAEGFWYDQKNSIFLGHRRLSIIDIETGSQPMWTHDNQIGITYNGEIYNHGELRKELESLSYQFFTNHSDTEVLLHGYREWGEKLPEKLNGMWAFVIYDKKENIFFCSRDRFGKKPFFYTLINQTFVFASELSALAKHGSVADFLHVSNKSLKKYFAYGYIPAPSSLYEKVYKLPGGYNLIFNIKNNEYKTKQYWEFEIDPFESIPRNPEEEWGEQIRHLLKQSVKRRLISDVPLGVFLSGGIDSASITAFASKIIGENKLKTFTIGFDEASFDETYYANIIAKILKTDHYSETLSIEGSRKLIPEIIKKLDEPMGDSSLIPTFLLCKVTRKRVTVALGGDGGDELFAGYDPFRALRRAEYYSKIISKPIHMAIRLIAAKLPISHRNMSLDFKIKKTLKGLSYDKKLWNPIWLGTLEPKELKELFNEPIDPEEVYSEAIGYWESCQQKNIIDKTLQFYTKLYLQDDILVKADRASMMNSLEVRTPYLDVEFLNLVRKIPYQYKYRQGQTKYILKKALEPVLPKEILYRPKKGFGLPIGKWFKEKAFRIAESTEVKDLNHNFALEQYAIHTKGKSDNRLFLWNYWQLQEYLKNN